MRETERQEDETDRDRASNVLKDYFCKLDHVTVSPHIPDIYKLFIDFYNVCNTMK